jgi:T-complex protein 11
LCTFFFNNSLNFLEKDIANHQLQSLRPFLLRSAPDYELRTFEEKRQKGQLDLAVTQKWLQTAHIQLCAENTPVPQTSSTILQGLRRSMQINIIVIKALIDLIFVPSAPVSFSPSSTPMIVPTATSTSAPPPPTPITAASSRNRNRLTPYNTVVHSMPGYPETLHLDHARMAIYTTDALDLTAIYMLMLLYRQLVFTETSHDGLFDKGRGGRKIVEAELMRLKAEIWAIAPPRLGYCFSPNWKKDGATAGEASSSGDGPNPPRTTNIVNTGEKELGRWYKGVKDVALHVVARAKDAEWRTAAASSSLSSTNARAPTVPVSPDSSSLSTCVPIAGSRTEIKPALAPDSQMLQLVESWCDTNLRCGSHLSILLRGRLRETMLHMVLGCYHNVNNMPPLRSGLSSTSLPASSSTPADLLVRGGLGMEPLTAELKQMAERIAKLAKIHIDVYGAVYEQEGFLMDEK